MDRFLVYVVDIFDVQIVVSIQRAAFVRKVTCRISLVKRSFGVELLVRISIDRQRKI